MKKLSITIIYLFLVITSFSQSPQQHQAPPLNNIPFTRGMFVDCMDEIVSDYKNGSPLALFDALKTYIQENYISYIALCDLDQGKVIGNNSMEASLKKILTELRISFPQIKIGLVGKQDGYTSRSGKIKTTDYFSTPCKTGPASPTSFQIDSMVNTVNNNEDLQRSETIKFFLRAMRFSTTLKGCCSLTYKSLFDVLYLDYPYWKDASSLPFATIQNRFNSYYSTLRLLQELKCSYTNISIEAEFQPTDLFWPNGWTSTDQIEKADQVIDRMIIPFYTDPYSSNSAINENCKLLHLVSDRFSKNKTRFVIGFSAQSDQYTFCNSTDTPKDHLGKYLSGQVSPSGNMFSVEDQFLTALNDPNYFCPTCSCYPYNDNHYSPTNTAGNLCDGSIWYTYTMLTNNQLYKQNQKAKEEELVAITVDQQIILSLTSEKQFTYKVYGIDGTLKIENNTKAFNHTVNSGEMNEGLYIFSANVSGKQLCRIIPVLNK